MFDDDAIATVVWLSAMVLGLVCSVLPWFGR